MISLDNPLFIGVMYNTSFMDASFSKHVISLSFRRKMIYICFQFYKKQVKRKFNRKVKFMSNAKYHSVPKYKICSDPNF